MNVASRNVEGRRLWGQSRPKRDDTRRCTMYATSSSSACNLAISFTSFLQGSFDAAKGIMVKYLLNVYSKLAAL